MRELGVVKENMYIDKASGKNKYRPQYQALLTAIKEGDLVYMDDLDRLGCSYYDVIDEWKYITRKVGADIVIKSNVELFDSRKFKSMKAIIKAYQEGALCRTYVKSTR